MSAYVVGIRGYRNLHDTELDVRPGVTAIVGGSDMGKSNVVRAIRDVFYGARGQGLVEAGQKAAIVEVDLGAYAVRLTKGPKVNTLELRVDDTWESFSGFGAQYPDAITERTRVRTVEVDRGVKIRPNVAEQHDPHFLLRETGATIARVLGSVSGLHVVFAAAREAQADADKAAKTAEATAAKHVEMQAQADAARMLSARLRAALTTADAIEKQRTAALERGIETSKFVLHLDLARKHRAGAADVAKRRAWAPYLVECTLPVLEKTIDKATQLRAARVSLEHAQQRADCAAERVPTDAGKPLLDRLERLEELATTLTTMRDLLYRARAAQLYVTTARKTAADTAKQVSASQAEYDAIETCPLCRQPMPGHEHA